MLPIKRLSLHLWSWTKTHVQHLLKHHHFRLKWFIQYNSYYSHSLLQSVGFLYASVSWLFSYCWLYFLMSLHLIFCSFLVKLIFDSLTPAHYTEDILPTIFVKHFSLISLLKCSVLVHFPFRFHMFYTGGFQPPAFWSPKLLWWNYSFLFITFKSTW